MEGSPKVAHFCLICSTQFRQRQPRLQFPQGVKGKAHLGLSKGAELSSKLLDEFSIRIGLRCLGLTGQEVTDVFGELVEQVGEPGSWGVSFCNQHGKLVDKVVEVEKIVQQIRGNVQEVKTELKTDVTEDLERVKEIEVLNGNVAFQVIRAKVNNVLERESSHKASTEDDELKAEVTDMEEMVEQVLEEGIPEIELEEVNCPIIPPEEEDIGQPVVRKSTPRKVVRDASSSSATPKKRKRTESVRILEKDDVVATTTTDGTNGGRGRNTALPLRREKKKRPVQDDVTTDTNGGSGQNTTLPLRRETKKRKRPVEDDTTVDTNGGQNITRPLRREKKKRPVEGDASADTNGGQNGTLPLQQSSIQTNPLPSTDPPLQKRPVEVDVSNGPDVIHDTDEIEILGVVRRGEVSELDTKPEQDEPGEAVTNLGSNGTSSGPGERDHTFIPMSRRARQRIDSSSSGSSSASDRIRPPRPQVMSPSYRRSRERPTTNPSAQGMRLRHSVTTSRPESRERPTTNPSAQGMRLRHSVTTSRPEAAVRANVSLRSASATVPRPDYRERNRSNFDTQRQPRPNFDRPPRGLNSTNGRNNVSASLRSRPILRNSTAPQNYYRPTPRRVPTRQPSQERNSNPRGRPYRGREREYSTRGPLGRMTFDRESNSFIRVPAPAPRPRPTVNPTDNIQNRITELLGNAPCLSCFQCQEEFPNKELLSRHSRNCGFRVF